MPTVSFTTIDYEPNPADGDNVGAYLHRAAFAITKTYGYKCTILLGKNEAGDVIQQLQVTVPDPGVTGDKRQVTIFAPEMVIDASGDIMTESAFTAKYGS